MADFYADWNIGDDAYDGTSPTDDGGGVGPVKHLSAGYALMSNTDRLLIAASLLYDEAGETADGYLNIATPNKSVTFEGTGSSRADVKFTSTHASFTVRLLTGADGSTITMKHMTLDKGVAGASSIMRVEANATPFAASFVLDDTVSNSGIRASSGTGGVQHRSVSVIDSVLVGTVQAVDAVAVTIRNSTYTDTNIDGNIGSVSITGGCIATGAFGFDAGGITAGLAGGVVITDLTCEDVNDTTSGINLRGLAVGVTIERNKIFVSSTASGIHLGEDTATNANQLTGDIVVRNNSVIYTGAVSGHGYLIGSGADEATVEQNYGWGTSTGGDGSIGTVVKAEGCTIRNNQILNFRRGLYFKGAGSNVAYNNHFEGTNLSALQFNTDTDLSTANEIYNNIFDASNGGTYAVVWDDSFDGNTRDNNLYVAGSTALARNNATATTYADLAALQAASTEDDNSQEGAADVDYLGTPIVNGNCYVGNGKITVRPGTGHRDLRGRPKLAAYEDCIGPVYPQGDWIGNTLTPLVQQGIEIGSKPDIGRG